MPLLQIGRLNNYTEKKNYKNLILNKISKIDTRNIRILKINLKNLNLGFNNEI